MRIDPNQTAQKLPEGGSRTNAASPSLNRSSSSVATGPGEDKAQLSGVHTRVPALVAQALQLPEDRQERVAALRQAVQSGSYSPDAKQVAGALLAHMLVKPAA